MNTLTSTVEESNSLSTYLNIYLKKYVNEDDFSYYNRDDLIDKENIDDLICPICFFILKEPLNCSDKKNSHSFCKECINEYLKVKNKCPTCKLNFEFKINNEKYNELQKLLFKCMFNKEGCTHILSYSDYLNHINNCDYNNTRYECNIMKYNYNKKEFEKCGFLGNKSDVENHFKSCAYKGFKCNFCGEYISNMNLEEHAKEKCKFGIFIYPSGNKYVGLKNVKNLNLKEGVGIFYFLQDIRIKYTGEFKNIFLTYLTDLFNYKNKKQN